MIFHFHYEFSLFRSNFCYQSLKKIKLKWKLWAFFVLYWFGTSRIYVNIFIFLNYLQFEISISFSVFCYLYYYLTTPKLFLSWLFFLESWAKAAYALLWLSNDCMMLLALQCKEWLLACFFVVEFMNSAR